MVRAKHETAMANLEEANKRLDRAKKAVGNKSPEARRTGCSSYTKADCGGKGRVREAKAMVYGLSPQQVSQLRISRRVSSELPLRSPVAGTVTARNVNPG